MTALARPEGRLQGIDMARALAIIGMLMAHVGPMRSDGLAGWLYGVPYGRASILFVLLAGIGVSLLARGRPGWLQGAPARLVWRGLWLLPLGLWLQTLDITALVILPLYAALFVAAIALLYLPDRWLLLLGLGIAIAGPLGGLGLAIYTPLLVGGRELVLGDTATELLLGLAVEGPYPLITWLVPFVFGMWLGRRNLRRGWTRLWCVLGGAALAAITLGLAVGLQSVFGTPGYVPGWDHLLLVEGHSEMPLWLWGATGTAVAVTGLCLVVADVGARCWWPLVAMGQLALTFYVAHLLVLARWPHLASAGSPGEAAPVVLALVVAAMALAVAWRWLFRRGPLETVLTLPWLLLPWLGQRFRDRAATR